MDQKPECFGIQYDRTSAFLQNEVKTVLFFVKINRAAAKGNRLRIFQQRFNDIGHRLMTEGVKYRSNMLGGNDRINAFRQSDFNIGSACCLGTDDIQTQRAGGPPAAADQECFSVCSFVGILLFLRKAAEEEFFVHLTEPGLVRMRYSEG